MGKAQACPTAQSARRPPLHEAAFSSYATAAMPTSTWRALVWSGRRTARSSAPGVAARPRCCCQPSLASNTANQPPWSPGGHQVVTTIKWWSDGGQVTMVVTTLRPPSPMVVTDHPLTTLDASRVVRWTAAHRPFKRRTGRPTGFVPDRAGG